MNRRPVLPILCVLAACSREGQVPDPPPVPKVELPFEQRPIDRAGMTRAFPSDRGLDRAAWAGDVLDLLTRHNLPTTNANACAVVAVVEQESGYNPNPTVPGIGGMVDRWVEEKAQEYGPALGWAVEAAIRSVLDTRAEGQTRTFYERLKAARTEKDVDLVYRDLIEHYRGSWPRSLEAAEFLGGNLAGLTVDDLNPITTAGCMQVKVEEARAHAREEGLDEEAVRDSLYTRRGCLHYGIVRLLLWEAAYSKPIYRFADFNAGLYSSRNAAFQAQVAALSGRSLALDGDLLIYGKDGEPSNKPSRTLQAVQEVNLRYGWGLSQSRIERDLAREKTQDFEDTQTWEKLKQTWKAQKGEKPAYAQMPEVKLDSAKIQGEKTTAWFAGNVDKRYQACLARVKAK